MASEDKILEEIIKACRDSIEPIRKNEIQELKYLLNKLEKRVTNKEDIYSGQTEKSREYWLKMGLGQSYFIRGSYTELLEIITKILDILRGQPLEILIQKNQRNSKGELISTTIYKGKESNLVTKTNKYRDIQYDLEKSIENFDKIQQANEAFKKHYSQFYDIAQKHIKSTRTQKSKQWRKKINEGNIVEAFQRHMQIKHLNDDIETSSYLDPIEPRDVIILLYYTIGNIPWWQQGDIGYLQVKANNLKLASQVSIRRVASKIKQMFQDLEHFDIEEFNRMFTAHDQKQMVDFSDLTKEEQNELIEDIRKDPNFKNITIKMFQ